MMSASAPIMSTIRWAMSAASARRSCAAPKFDRSGISPISWRSSRAKPRSAAAFDRHPLRPNGEGYAQFPAARARFVVDNLRLLRPAGHRARSGTAHPSGGREIRPRGRSRRGEAQAAQHARTGLPRSPSFERPDIFSEDNVQMFGLAPQHVGHGFLFRCMRMKRQRNAKCRSGQRDYARSSPGACAAVQFGPATARAIACDAYNLREL